MVLSAPWWGMEQPAGRRRPGDPVGGVTRRLRPAAARRHGLGRRPACGAGPGRPLARRQRVRLLRPPGRLPALLHRVLVPLRRGRPALAPHSSAPGGGNVLGSSAACPSPPTSSSGLWTLFFTGSTRLDFPSPRGLRLPPLHAQDPAAAAREEVLRPPRALRDRLQRSCETRWCLPASHVLS